MANAKFVFLASDLMIFYFSLCFPLCISSSSPWAFKLLNNKISEVFFPFYFLLIDFIFLSVDSKKPILDVKIYTIDKRLLFAVIASSFPISICSDTIFQCYKEEVIRECTKAKENHIQLLKCSHIYNF